MKVSDEIKNRQAETTEVDMHYALTYTEHINITKKASIGLLVLHTS